MAYVPEALRGEGGEGGEASREGTGPAQEEYDDRAYPRSTISYKRTVAARRAFRGVVRATQPHVLAAAGSWQELGPVTPIVPDLVTYTGRETTNSGRVTALAIAPSCNSGDCRLWVGAAGGGVWRTDDALASKPTWESVSKGLGTNAIGSIVVDPNDPSGERLYVGTGEPNGSGDSEAGLGLYRSANEGDSWSLVSGSVPVAKNRSIGSIAIDPTDPSHIYIGTDVARHGSSAVNGGRRTPPNAPTLGLYESTDAGSSFDLIFSLPPNPTPPSTGFDWFQGGVNSIRLDPNDPDIVYAAVLGYGIWRSSLAVEGDADFHQVLATMNPDDFYGDRSEFSLVDMGSTTRIYAGDSSDDLARAHLWRVDDANVPASSLASHGKNVGWTKLTSSKDGTPGFGAYSFCGGQCGYDMFVVSPPDQPDTVWLGGQMNYGELGVFGGLARSNGRTVLRSTDAGVSVTDMTNDAQNPPVGMHPDQHAIVFDPDNPDVAFIGSDGGVVRTSGTYVDDSAECASRGLSGADLTDCRSWLSAVPSKITSLNDGLATIQFQSLSYNPQDPTGDLMGGTQDNGTFVYDGTPTWIESIGGDGGQSGVDAVDPNIRVHSYYLAQIDVNFHGTDKDTWLWVADPLLFSGEFASFYVPLITDPVVGGTMFVGQQHVWRTKDAGGDEAYLTQYCDTYHIDPNHICGDWSPLGGSNGDLTSAVYGRSRSGEYVVANERAPSDTGTMWAATRPGRVFVSKNADAKAKQVTFTRIDSKATPGRFVSGIAVDPQDPNHAWVSYSGYGAYTPTTPGHVFEVSFDPAAGTATWTDRSNNIGDQPVTGVVFDDVTGDLYAATDFGVLRLTSGGVSWLAAAPGLPFAAVYGLTIATGARVLYAATHGRGAWRLDLS